MKVTSLIETGSKMMGAEDWGPDEELVFSKAELKLGTMIKFWRLMVLMVVLQ